jgi:hypothetical protein
LRPGQLAQDYADRKLVSDTPPDQIWDVAMTSLGMNARDLFTGGGVN